jgi:hypothetical protein
MAEKKLCATMLPTKPIAKLESRLVPMPIAGEPSERSSVPGCRTSVRVATRAKARGSSMLVAATASRSAAGAALVSSANTCCRCSGVNLAKASVCACSSVSGGAVRSM